MNEVNKDIIVEKIKYLSTMPHSALVQHCIYLENENDSYKAQKYITDFISENGIICEKNKEIEELQSKIDKANELLREILVVNDWEHKGRYRPVKNTTAQDVYKTICKLYAILETPYRSDYGALKENE